MSDPETLSILLVDDDEDEFVLLKRLLGRAGHPYTLDWTASPAAALADMGQCGHEVYLVDFQMGEVTGVELIHQAVLQGCRAPLILLTGTGSAAEDRGVDVEALRVGAADYLDKQAITPESLDRSIRYARERAHSARLRESLGQAQAEEGRLQVALQEVERQAQRLQLLADASTLFTSTRLDPGATLTEVARRCAELLGDACGILLVASDDPEGAVIRAFHHRESEMRPAGEKLLGQTIVLHDSMAGQLIRAGPTLIPVLDVGEAGWADAPWLAQLTGGTPRSLIGAPLRAGGQTFGAVLLTRYREGAPYTADDRTLLQDIADRAALAIENARLFESQVVARTMAERAAERTARLQATTAALAGAMTPPEVGAVVLQHAMAALAAGSGSVYLKAGDEHLERLAFRERQTPERPPDPELPLTLDLPITAVVRIGGTFFFEDRQSIIDRFPTLGSPSDPFGPQALVALALAVESRILGAIGLAFDRPRSFSPQDRELALAVAQQCAQALDRAQLAESERRARARASLLAEASALLASSLDPPTVLSNVAKLLVPGLADQCSIHMLEGTTLRCLATSSLAEGGRVPLGPALQEVSEQDLDPGVLEVLHSGRPRLYAESEESARRSALIVPLVASGKTLGTMTLIRRDPAHAYGDDDLGFMLDLAHRSALAIENARLYQEAKLAIEVRDEFLAVAGHELKTPLAALLMQVEGLARMVHPDSDPRMRPRLEKAAAAGRRLDALIDEMLDVTRITSGRLRLEPQPLDLDEVVREVVGRFSDQAARSRTPISVRLEPGVKGQWDRMRVEQLVANLVSNALKYGAGKPILVQLTTVGGQAVLRVTDQGMGIERDQQRRIFERFERAVATREYGGFGLGLWIARQVAEASGGRVEVHSEPGQGATFTVTLPRAAQEAHAPH